MMTNHTAHDGESFVIPSRTLRGSKRDMVQDIDEAIIGLLALRHLIDGTAPLPDAQAGRGGRLAARPRLRWRRLFSRQRPFGFWS